MALGARHVINLLKRLRNDVAEVELVLGDMRDVAHLNWLGDSMWTAVKKSTKRQLTVALESESPVSLPALEKAVKEKMKGTTVEVVCRIED